MEMRLPVSSRMDAAVTAAEEERFRRIGHWAGFPSEAIRYCLSVSGLKLNISMQSQSTKACKREYLEKSQLHRPTPP